MCDFLFLLFLTNIITLLPDAVANQIAAGEVVQRPANAVKELLENSLDAGATKISLLIRDGGITSIQVIDNGKGMSEMDVRLCWERYATSKIKKVEDLFQLQTYGFRGEAMASIAAVSQVEMKSRRTEDEWAQYIRIEGSIVIEQKPDASPIGTSITLNNLFYNIPARRNFLKSISVETKHIMEEFLRQAMANPQVDFSYYNNSQMVYHFKAKAIQERVLETLGKKNGADFLPVEEDTEIVDIRGFVGIPGIAKRVRGEQYFFMNGRFIRSHYFHHAVSSAYVGLIENDAHPSYVIFLQVDPSKVDVNVHPNKTEVKFEDEKHIYNLIKAAIRKSLSNFVVQPASDVAGFSDFESLINQPLRPPSNDNSGNHTKQNLPEIGGKRDLSYTPFQGSGLGYSRSHGKDWQRVLGSIEQTDIDPTSSTILSRLSEPTLPFISLDAKTHVEINGAFALNERYIVANVGGQLLVVEKKLAQQHIYFYEYLKHLELQTSPSQQLLFPRTVEFPPAQIPLVVDMIDELHYLGFDISHFGGNTLIVNGLPPLLSQGDEQALIEQLLEDYQHTQGDITLSKYQSMALSMARHAVKRSQVGNSTEELNELLRRLFQLGSTGLTFDGKSVYIEITSAQLYDRFQINKNKT